MNQRMYFLDNLRAVVIFLVVVLHVSLCYMKFAPSWWFVIDPAQSMFFTYAVMLIDVPIMAVMFFLAGYFALPSLQKHGQHRFWVGKFRRIIIPWVLGVLFLSPPAMYMILLSRGKAPGYMEFWAGPFWGPLYSQSVFWFLGLLVMFYLILCGCYRLFPGLQSPPRVSRNPSPLFPILFISVSAGYFLGMNQFFPVDKWITDCYLIVFQPVRLLIYLFYFGLGVLAWKRNWFTRQGYTPKLLPWLIVCLVSAVVYLTFKGMMATRGTELPIQLGNALGFNVFAYSTLMAGTALFKAFVSSSNGFWRFFSASSYGLYLFHSLAVYYGAYYLLNMDASPFVKAPILLVSSTAFCWVLTVALKKVKGISSVL
ncbi:acyltransferase family protein [Desulfovibrio sp. JC010]|uniref:acyltransferase family protein n=1 Tax=Desulfovibrio sp. JC010 TaxID=2593641 RepID=UPI0013D6DA62|nr:acyltransferase family protein [Desulfovibrio sp. JC010]